MRLFGAALAICVALTACKKKAQLVAPAAQEAAKATPASSATPLPEPVNLKSQVIVLCYHRFEDNPLVGINSPRCAMREWTLRATPFRTVR